MQSINTQDGILAAAWPHCNCDCAGFMYDPTFKLPWLDSNISVEREQIQDIMREVKPCAKC